MKWKTIFALLMFALLLLGNIFARETRLIGDKVDKASKWVERSKGVSYQELWSDGEPQVAVLKLSNDAYEDFKIDPARFINKYKFFSATVRDPSDAGVLLSAPQQPEGFWFVIIPHGHMSRTYYAGVPQPPEN